MKFLPLMLLLFVSSAFTQEKYDFGKIDEIKGMSKVYVSANAGDREAIIKILDGKVGLVVVDKVEDAEFYINYQQLGNTNQVGFLNFGKGQLDVYLKKGERLRAVWLKELTGPAFKAAVPKELAKKFLKDFEKLSK